MPQAGQGSGKPVAQRARLPQTGVNSPYDTKALFKLKNSPDRLLGIMRPSMATGQILSSERELHAALAKR
jgi:hypothetical protein